MSARPSDCSSAVRPARRIAASVGPTRTSSRGSAFRADSSDTAECLVSRAAQLSIRSTAATLARLASADRAGPASRWITSRPPIAVVAWLKGAIGSAAGTGRARALAPPPNRVLGSKGSFPLSRDDLAGLGRLDDDRRLGRRGDRITTAVGSGAAGSMTVAPGGAVCPGWSWTYWIGRCRMIGVGVGPGAVC